ncbi:MAG: ammonium transporter, partial [Planctomycetota bacterium]
MLSETTDQIWLIACSGLVLVMQAGFLCLESGLTRSKNAVNVGVKNLLDFSVSLLLFYLIGFSIMFGASRGGWIGVGGPPDLAPGGSAASTFLIFQALFCATAATIVSGAVAERMLMRAYLVTTVVVSGLLYPFVGHWAWGGAAGGEPGWLAALGFVDFAGSGVVHMTGGFAALAAIAAIGPRSGRFGADGKPNEMPPSNLSFVMLGALALLVGWIGFNGGSTLAFNGQAPAIIWNTLLAAAAGGLAGMGVGLLQSGGKRVAPSAPVNGLLAGLVAITASAHATPGWAAIVIGATGAVAMAAGEWVLLKMRLDDAVGAFPVHGAAGVWGLICVALFGEADSLGTGLTIGEQLIVQATGAATIAAAAYVVVRLALLIVPRVVPLRATAEQEASGLNVVEHGVRSEL